MPAFELGGPLGHGRAAVGLGELGGGEVELEGFVDRFVDRFVERVVGGGTRLDLVSRLRITRDRAGFRVSGLDEGRRAPGDALVV